jgi:phage terminase large subunit-like protein
MNDRFDDDSVHVVAPQEGPQTLFCETSADIAIYGGEAGSGKTMDLIIEGSRYHNEKKYTGVIFRREYNDIVAGGGLWDTSQEVYPYIGGHGVRGKTIWNWPRSKAKIKFTHLNSEKDVYNHQGAAYVFLAFDELTHFTKFQFFYLLTRNRPPAGCTLRPYCRATCNADADSWVADLIKWWWDPATGYPIRERSGQLRYFTVENNEVVWVEKEWRHPVTGLKPRSLTFIAARLSDNKLMAHRAEYEAGLDAQDRVTRERLKEGNWLISYGGNMFNASWFEIVDTVPKDMRLVRYWDFAASEVDEAKKNDPDWTAGALCGIHQGILYILDITAFRESPGQGEKLIKQAALQDGHSVEVWWEEEKGSAGKWTSQYLKSVFSGYEAHADPVTGSKVERAKPWSAWAEFGRVKLLRGEWNRKFLTQAGKFPEGKKDLVDSVSGGFKALIGPRKVFALYIPNDAGHVQNFSREREDFAKITPANCEVYVSLWADSGGAIVGGCYIWSLRNKRLRLYNEIYMLSPTAADLVAEVTEKVVVPLLSKPAEVTVHKIIANDAFFNMGGESMAKEVKRAGLKIRPNEVYDEAAAIMKIAEMFATKGIIIHADCVETDTQWRGWSYDDKGKTAEGYQLARALCLLVSELKASGRMDEPHIIPAYSMAKRGIREMLRGSSQNTILSNTGVMVENKDKQYEYLTR